MQGVPQLSGSDYLLIIEPLDNWPEQRLVQKIPARSGHAGLIAAGPSPYKSTSSSSAKLRWGGQPAVPPP